MSNLHLIEWLNKNKSMQKNKHINRNVSSTVSVRKERESYFDNDNVYIKTNTIGDHGMRNYLSRFSFRNFIDTIFKCVFLF